jgi:hypothetical protein
VIDRITVVATGKLPLNPTLLWPVWFLLYHTLVTHIHKHVYVTNNNKKRQQRSYSRQPSTDHEESDDELREPSEWDYPDQALQRHMELLDEKRTANLERLNNIFELQKKNLKKMSDAFEYQAWEDFAVRDRTIQSSPLVSVLSSDLQFSRLSLRRSMTEHVYEKIVKLQDELEGRPVARGTKSAVSRWYTHNLILYIDPTHRLPTASANPLHLAWNPPERPESINILFGKICLSLCYCYCGASAMSPLPPFLPPARTME